jgi:hypothetical protein
MAALFIACGAQTNATHGALFHVVVVGFMPLHVRAERNGSVFRGIYVLARHNVPGRVLPSDPVIGSKGIQPEHGVFYKMDQDDSWEAANRKHAIGTAGTLFDGSNVSFDVGDVFIRKSGVEIVVPWTQHLKLVVAKDGVNNKSAGPVEVKDRLEKGVDGGDSTILEKLNSGEV